MIEDRGEEKGIAAVTEIISGDELARATTNIRRIEEFLAERLEWHLELEGHEALSHLDNAAVSMIRTLDPILDANGVRADWGDMLAPDQLPTSKFDSNRLDRLAAFMVELDVWFQSNADVELEPGAAPKLGDIYGALQTIRKAITPILEASPFRDQVPEQRPPADVQSAPPADTGPAAAQPSVTAAFAAGPAGGPSEGAVVVGPGGGGGATTSLDDRLILEDSELKPLLQTFQNETELTPDARGQLDEFLGRHNVEFSGYQRNKFDSEVERRIQSTPQGQVLVVKIGDLEGDPKPFFSYQPKIQEPPSE
jgi:hypothetical protein